MATDHPIIKSLNDIDFYKHTMCQVALHRGYTDVPVEYRFLNRTKKIALPEYFTEDRLRSELDAIRKLRFTKSEITFLRGQNRNVKRMFQEDYLDFLGGVQLPEYQLSTQGDHFDLRFPGPWGQAIFWETIALSIVTELFGQAQLSRLTSFEQEVQYAQAKVRLLEKIKKIRKYPRIFITDFGTRRRFSRKWQKFVDRVLATELGKQFLGTSNTLNAMLLSLLPMGTSAHEMYMIYSAIFRQSDHQLRESHNRVLQDWWDEYGWDLSVALPDTYGSDFFFRDFLREQAVAWKGLRHDSGDPFEFAEKTIAFYEGLGIDPRTKMIVFSDGLEVDTIIELFLRFGDRILVSFGWGTTLTNDLGFTTLSLVIKAAMANHLGTVKLSDNLAKAMGSEEDIARFKNVFGYKEATYTECMV
jgi:nicotinate phosphoribosyltransferase